MIFIATLPDGIDQWPTWLGRNMNLKLGRIKPFEQMETEVLHTCQQGKQLQMK